MRANAKTTASKDTKAVGAERSRPAARRARFDASPYLFILGFVVFCSGDAALPGGVQV